MFNKKLLFAVISVILVAVLSVASMAVVAAEGKDEGGIPVESQNIDEEFSGIEDPSGSETPSSSEESSDYEDSSSSESTPVAEQPVKKSGDIDGNKVIDINDVTEYQLTLAGVKPVTDTFKLNGDTHVNNKYNILDASAIQYYVAGTFRKLPVTIDGYYAEIIRP